MSEKESSDKSIDTNKALKSLSRYDPEGDAYSIGFWMEKTEKGEYVKFEDVLKVIGNE